MVYIVTSGCGGGSSSLKILIQDNDDLPNSCFLILKHTILEGDRAVDGSFGGHRVELTFPIE